MSTLAEKLAFLAELASLPPAGFPDGDEGDVQSGERAAAKARAMERFCKSELDCPGLQQEDEDYYDALCEARQRAQGFLDEHGKSTHRQLRHLYGNLCDSLEFAFQMGEPSLAKACARTV